MQFRMLLAALAVSTALLAPAEAKIFHRTTRPATASRKAPKTKAAKRRAPTRPKIKRQKPPAPKRHKATRATTR
jgi:hypothetical protein